VRKKGKELQKGLLNVDVGDKKANGRCRGTAKWWGVLVMFSKGADKGNCPFALFEPISGGDERKKKSQEGGGRERGEAPSVGSEHISINQERDNGRTSRDVLRGKHRKSAGTNKKFFGSDINFLEVVT